MNKTFQCEYMTRDGICNGNLEVCCIYQNSYKYSDNDDHWKEIHSIHETFCDYPKITIVPEYAKAITDLSKFINIAKGETIQ